MLSIKKQGLKNADPNPIVMYQKRKSDPLEEDRRENWHQGVGITQWTKIVGWQTKPKTQLRSVFLLQWMRWRDTTLADVKKKTSRLAQQFIMRKLSDAVTKKGLLISFLPFDNSSHTAPKAHAKLALTDIQPYSDITAEKWLNSSLDFRDEIHSMAIFVFFFFFSNPHNRFEIKQSKCDSRG